MAIDWKQKVKHTKSGMQIELRGKASNGTQILIIVGDDGWDFTKYECRNLPDDQYAKWRQSTRGHDVRISMNGPAWLTNEDLKHMNIEIEKAKITIGLTVAATSAII